MANKKIIIWGCTALAIIICSWLILGILLPVGGGGKKIIRIPSGSSAAEIGQILAAEGVIRSPFGFRILARVTGKGTKLQPGAYELNPPMSPLAVIDKLAKGDVCAHWVTFPEGFTILQIAECLGEKDIMEPKYFSGPAYFNGRNFPANFPHPSDSLEGYLFPDTYLIPVGESADGIIREMLSCFERKVAEPLAADIAQSDMSLHKIITLASLIEREAKVSKDRPLISAILRNRLRKNMRLQCDATVLYALGRHKNRVLYRDLTVDSPYNTYRYPGLPPGPIANPGLASIKAALHPAKVDYLYYVARPDGSHIFSHTLAEHQLARQIVRRGGNN